MTSKSFTPELTEGLDQSVVVKEIAFRWKRERDEFAAALGLAFAFLRDMRMGLARLDGQGRLRHWENLDEAIGALEKQIADPSACLKAYEDQRSENRQQKSVLAEAARQLLHCSQAHHEEHAWESALQIAHFLGYRREFSFERIDTFLDSVSVGEAAE